MNYFTSTNKTPDVAKDIRVARMSIMNKQVKDLVDRVVARLRKYPYDFELEVGLDLMCPETVWKDDVFLIRVRDDLREMGITLVDPTIGEGEEGIYVYLRGTYTIREEGEGE
jgi:hypothetical protein